MYGSIACEKWLKETIFDVAEVAALVADIDHVVVGEVIPEDVSMPAVLISSGGVGRDVTSIGTHAKVTAEFLRFQVAVIAEGESYSPIIPAAVGMHNRIHSSHNNQVTHPDLEGTYSISSDRVGELPMRRVFATDMQGGRHYVQLGGEYELQVTQGG